MKSLSTVFFLVFSLAASAFAADVEPTLLAKVKAAKVDDMFSVIVLLHNPRSIAELDQDLHARRAPLAERHKLVIDALKANAAETQGPVISKLESAKEAGEVGGYTAYWIENIIVVYGTASAILELAGHPAVNSIGPNFETELIEPVVRGPIRGERPHTLDDELTTPGQDAIRATQVNRELGINGSGVLVANLDTGVDRFHPALGSRWRGTHAPTDECWLDLLGGFPMPSDQNGHGTHVMGTECGREITTGGDTITVGSAPLAEWIACNAIGGFGQDFSQDILDAYEWFIDPDGDPLTLDDVPDVIQNSWGVNTGLGYPHCYTNWNTVITNCEAAGVVITWSAGNESTQGLRSPAIFELSATEIFSVGAVDANPNTPPFLIADFSSRGPSTCPPDPDAIKPEIAAPGVDVYSSVPGGGYVDFYSGTSMAGPHVAGCVGLMREACPDCDPQTIKEALMETAIDEGYPPAGEDNTFGHGFIDCYEAVLAVASLGRVDGFCEEADGTPVEGVRIQADGMPNSTTSRANGYYNLSAAEGTYTVRYAKFGYETEVFTDVQTTEGETTRVDVTMDLLPVGVLNPTVVTQLGVGLQGAIVTFPGIPVDTVITDENGQVSVSLPVDTYAVHIHFRINRTPPELIDKDTTVILTQGQNTPTWPVFINTLEPAGPDGYGYLAYDRYDRDFPATYDWVEMDPNRGGTVGTPFTYTTGDTCVHFAAPFPIGFYGEDFDSLTVNTNGWMLPGVYNIPGPLNQPIPSISEPNGIIAAFWDDIRRGLGATQYQYYDRANGRWVFEFVDQQLQVPGGRFHDWEVHFLDPARYPTATGDCQILCVYQRMQYVGSASVGIEHPNNTTGVQVQHNSNLHQTAWPIEAGAALRFTTGLPTATGTLNGTLTLYPDQSEAADLQVWVAGQLLNMNAQGQFSTAAAPAAPVHVLLDEDGYETVRALRVVVPANGTATANLECWRLDPPRDLSATQWAGDVTIRWWRPLSVTAHANPAVRYDLYVDGFLSVPDLADTFYVEHFASNDTVEFRVLAHYPGGDSELSDPLAFVVDLGASPSQSGLPKEFALHQNFPNPFNPQTSIRLDVPLVVDGSLIVYDIQGREVTTLWHGPLSTGIHQFNWNGKNREGHSVGTGLYLYEFRSSAFTAVNKMMLLK